MATWISTARRATLLSRLSSPNLIQQRSLAGTAEHHGAPRVNFWQDPMHPSKWKRDHVVIVSGTGLGLLLYTGYKYNWMDIMGKKNEKVGDGSH